MVPALPLALLAQSSKDTGARRKAREHLESVIWAADGTRKLPRERALVEALTACHKDDVWWVCEASSFGPVYLLPTVEWISICAEFITSLGVKSVLEVGAGDGLVATHLSKAMSKIRYTATDNSAWSRPNGRMSAADKAEFAGVPFSGIPTTRIVKKMASSTAVKKYQPDLVLAVWPPPGLMVERAITGPSRYVLDVSVEGDVCGNGYQTWRYEHAVAAGPVADRALCRLDSRPKKQRHTRITLYRGARG